jgi:outer membrane protein OmpA-like peptidoglycan-associated protein
LIHIIIFFSLFSLINAKGQSLASDCSEATIIQLNHEGIHVDSTLYYRPVDEFVYWYRIEVLAHGIVTIYIEPLNAEDIYHGVIYQYFPPEDFCIQLVHGNLKPLETSLVESPEVSTDNQPVSYHIEKKGIYYLAIINTYGKDCGHLLKISFNHNKKQIQTIKKENCIQQETVKDTSKKKIKVEPPVILETQTIQYEEKKVSFDVSVNHQKVETDNLKMVITKNGERIETEINDIILSSPEDSVMITLSKTGYHDTTFTLTYKMLSSINNKMTIELRRLEVGTNFILDNIYFYPNSPKIKESSFSSLEKLLDFMKENPEAEIEITGHTAGNKYVNPDPRYRGKGPEWEFKGSAKKLSKARAERVKRFLVSKGIEASRIKTKGMGGNQLLIPNPITLEERRKNMRVEIKIISY